MKKIIFIFALILILKFASATLQTSEFDATSLISSINAKRAEKCLSALTFDSSLANEAKTKAESCDFGNVYGYAGVRLNSGSSYTPNQLAGWGYPLNIWEQWGNFWSCSGDTCSHSNKAYCYPRRIYMEGQATKIGCAASRCSVSTGGYHYYFFCKTDKGSFGSSDSNPNLISPGSCSGTCTTPAPTPAPTSSTSSTSGSSTSSTSGSSTSSTSSTSGSSTSSTPAPTSSTSSTSGSSTSSTSGSSTSSTSGSSTSSTSGSSSSSTSTTTGSSSYNPPQAEIDAWLQAHNKFRCSGNLQWDSTLAAYAKAHAENLLASPNNNAQCTVISHNSTELNALQQGENIYSLPYGSNTENIRYGVNMWALEGTYYNSATGACSPTTVTIPVPNGATFGLNPGTCGHYTQLIWGATTKVGCAIISCPNNSQFPSNPYRVGVCRYQARGNMNGQLPITSSQTSTCTSNLNSNLIST